VIPTTLVAPTALKFDLERADRRQIRRRRCLSARQTRGNLSRVAECHAPEPSVEPECTVMRRYELASTVHPHATDGLYANGGEDKGPWKGEESCTSRQLLSQCSS
jgi:hypothetical protein